MKPRRTKKARPVRRALLLQLVTDLCERLQTHTAIAEAIQAAAAPHDHETVAVWQRCKVLELALDRHAAKARDVRGLAGIIRDRMNPKGGAK
jgi:hypothetical protein